MEEFTDEKPIMLTQAAVEAALSIKKSEGNPEDYIRVSVIGGGCAGYQYDLNFDSNVRPTDIQLTYDSLTVLIDPISGSYLKGTKIDFIKGLNGGFNFINPNAKRTCGCGSSWS